MFKYSFFMYRFLEDVFFFVLFLLFSKKKKKKRSCGFDRCCSRLCFPTINTENVLHCKTHREDAYYFLKAIIACVVFFLFCLMSDRKASLQSMTTSAMFILEHRLLQLAYNAGSSIVCQVLLSGK